MSAGQTVRRSLRAGRVRIALGVTGAAAALAIGGSFTAHADNSASEPKPVPTQVTYTELCPEPVEAVPNGADNTVKDNQVTYTTTSEDPVDAVPGGECVDPGPNVGDPVEATPDGKDTAPDHSARDAKPAPAKR
ncbi:hypothetical protein [Streptomyces sp. NBC_00986]|uniref:hypothetical protein n=1 Tax=Streptomyces sp. NBC_00986 TaxID=2903702 RepID=UPI00386D42AB|nr:hypothetical protein OG504_04760 [Streptomyces sp. NBC_00986]